MCGWEAKGTFHDDIIVPFSFVVLVFAISMFM